MVDGVVVRENVRTARAAVLVDAKHVTRGHHFLAAVGTGTGERLGIVEVGQTSVEIRSADPG